MMEDENMKAKGSSPDSEEEKRDIDASNPPESENISIAATPKKSNSEAPEKPPDSNNTPSSNQSNTKKNETPHSFKLRNELSRALFGKTRAFYFTTEISGYTGEMITESEDYGLKDGRSNLKDIPEGGAYDSAGYLEHNSAAKNVQDAIDDAIEDDNDEAVIFKKTSNQQDVNNEETEEKEKSCVEDTKAEIIQEETSIDKDKEDQRLDIEENESKENESTTVEENKSAVSSEKKDDSVYFDAMRRLGPSMNEIENKLHDIRSLSSLRRLRIEDEIDDENLYRPKILNFESKAELSDTIQAELKSQRKHVIDLQKLRRLSSQGIPDKGSHRAVTWRVLLGFLPVECRKWEKVLERERGLYRKLVSELFVNPSHSRAGANGKNLPNEKKSLALLELDSDGLKRPSTLIDGMTLSNNVDFMLLQQMSRINAETIEECNSRVSLRSAEFGEDDPFSNTGGSTPKKNTANDIMIPIAPSTQTPTVQNTEQHTKQVIDDPLQTSSNITNEIIKKPNSNRNMYGESVDDNPLSVENDSQWAQFFENEQLLDEIRKDVVRTHPDLHFFLEPERNLGKRRYAALERILFVWAKLNHGVKYVQGMNEIVGTIYFVLATDFNEEWACEAEADTYFLFNLLMNDMRDIFIPDLDNADTGIQGRIHHFKSLLSLHDPEVRCHLDDLDIDASFFAVRWLTTLLSREFLLPDTIRLWDSMFASTHKDNFLRYVCVTMLMFIREKLLSSDFTNALRLLQSFPPMDVGTLLETSRALWIYESQITLACHRGGISLQQALNTINPPKNIVMAYGLVGGISAATKRRMMKNNNVSEGENTTQEKPKNTGNSLLSSFNGFLFRQHSSSENDNRRRSKTSSIKRENLERKASEAEISKSSSKDNTENKMSATGETSASSISSSLNSLANSATGSGTMMSKLKWFEKSS